MGVLDNLRVPATVPGMRAALPAILLALASHPALAVDDLPTKDCASSFVHRWQNNREAALAAMPKQPCWLRSPTGAYVCYKDGCVRSHVYFSGQN